MRYVKVNVYVCVRARLCLFEWMNMWDKSNIPTHEEWHTLWYCVVYNTHQQQQEQQKRKKSQEIKKLLR